ncbi:MAG: MFS transporter [Candidatus Aminicenantes bacterium]|nr:MAG: MFS transporter [Candidatus Aminicenantes bacterium]
MTNIRLHRILSRFAKIKQGEEVIALLLFLYFFLIMFPYYIIKPYRDAKYLIEVGSRELPIAYLSTAIIIGFFVAFYSRLQVKVKRHSLIISSLIFFIVTCLLSREFFIRDKVWMPLAFWVWANVFIVVLVAQFWMLVNDVFNPREAKRLIGFFGSGGILGGILGALLVGLLGRDMPDDLLFIASGVLILGGFVVNSIFIWQRRKKPPVDEPDNKDNKGGKEPAKVGFIDNFNTVRKNHYLTLLAMVVILTFVVATFIDFQSKTVIEVKVERMDEMTEFFGYFHAGLLVLPFFLQLFMTSNIIRRYGIRFTLLLFPFVLILCSMGIYFWPAILFAVAIKSSDKGLSFSLNQSARELLYIPISPEIKYKAKVFIDMFLNRFAKGIGALILLIFIFVLPEAEWVKRIKIVSIATLVFILAWILINLKISKEYTNTVKQKLELKWDRADRVVAEKVDVDYMKLVFDTIESKERSSVLYAMHLFDLIKQDKLTPEIKELISYKSDEVRVSSLGGLFESGETTLFPMADDYMSEEVLEKEIEEIMSLDVYQEVMKDYVEKALKDESLESETTKMEVAKAIGLMDLDSPLALKLEELLWDESPEVSKYALESAARLKRREYVPAMIKKLQSLLTREDASVALEKYGSKVAGTLEDYLGDPAEDIELRRGAASVLARIGTQEAADFLCWELSEGRGDITYELIDALDKIRSEKQDVQFSQNVVRAEIMKEVKKLYKTFIKSCDSSYGGKKIHEDKDLAESLNVSLRNIFKLLGLIYPHEDIFKAYQNIKTGTKESMDYAIELLDNMLDKEIRDMVFSLVEDLTVEERVKRCRSLLKSIS